MIKFYCDRCNKECGKLREVQIPDIKDSEHILTKTIHVCRECKEEVDNINDKLTDIRFVLFRDFMKGGAE